MALAPSLGERDLWDQRIRRMEAKLDDIRGLGDFNREFAHAWACCAFGGRIAHFQPLFVHNSAYRVAECSKF